MERKKALIAAGAISGTLVAASTVFALTGGVLNAQDSDGAGTVSPIATVSTDAPGTTGAPGTTTVPVTTGAPGTTGLSVIDQPTLAAPVAPQVQPPASAPVTRSSASAVGGDDDEYEDEVEDEGEYEDESEDAEHADDESEDREGEDEDDEQEYEGAEDDD